MLSFIFGARQPDEPERRPEKSDPPNPATVAAAVDRAVTRFKESPEYAAVRAGADRLAEHAEATLRARAALAEADAAAGTGGTKPFGVSNVAAQRLRDAAVRSKQTWEALLAKRTELTACQHNRKVHAKAALTAALYAELADLYQAARAVGDDDDREKRLFELDRIVRATENDFLQDAGRFLPPPRPPVPADAVLEFLHNRAFHAATGTVRFHCGQRVPARRFGVELATTLRDQGSVRLVGPDEPEPEVAPIFGTPTPPPPADPPPWPIVPANAVLLVREGRSFSILDPDAGQKKFQAGDRVFAGDLPPGRAAELVRDQICEIGTARTTAPPAARRQVVQVFPGGRGDTPRRPG
jgi:hypothetical protein